MICQRMESQTENSFRKIERLENAVLRNRVLFLKCLFCFNKSLFCKKKKKKEKGNRKKEPLLTEQKLVLETLLWKLSKKDQMCFCVEQGFCYSPKTFGWVSNQDSHVVPMVCLATAWKKKNHWLQFCRGGSKECSNSKKHLSSSFLSNGN